MHHLDFEIAGATHTACIDKLVVAGWTGRDPATVEQHIAELAVVGVRRPVTVPCFYRVGTNLLTQAETIDVAGFHSSGEVEVVMVSLANGLCVGVGSDHTDRKVEAYGIRVSKQMCPKPVSRQLWEFSEVDAHWDDLILRCWVTHDGTRELYQEGRAAQMLSARDLMARYLGRPGILPVGTAMYCGTLTVNGVIRGGERFELELEDPRLERRLQHAYLTSCLDCGDDESPRRTDGDS